MKKQKVDGLNTSLKLLVKTSFVVFIGLMLSKVLGYAYRIVIARYFGPEVYGLFSLAIMVSGWFIAASALGLSDGLLRFISVYRGSRKNEHIKYIINFSAWTLAITSILSGFLLYFLSNYIALTFFHDARLIIYLQIFSIVVPVSVLSSVYMTSLRAHEEIGWYSFIFNIAQGAIKIIALVLLIILGMGSNSVSLSYLAGLFGMLVMAYLVCRYKIPHLFGIGKLPHDEKGKIRSALVSYSIPLLFFGIISTIFYWIDSFSIGFYKSVFEVGLYNAAIPIAMLLGVAPEIFMQLFFPMITKHYAQRKVKLIEELSKQVAKWILLVNIPVFAIMIVFPGALINIFFGASYLAAENALRILAISSLISSVFIISSQLISMIGRSKLVLMNIVIASIVNLTLNMILVPMPVVLGIDNSNGLAGASLATLISITVFNLIFMIEAYRNLSIIPLRRKMIRLFIIALIPTGLLFYARTIFTSNSIVVLAALAAAFMLVYIALILLSGSLDENDWGMIKNILRRVKLVR